MEQLDEKNQTSFLAELGGRLHSLLLNHFKCYVVSDAGALILQK